MTGAVLDRPAPAGERPVLDGRVTLEELLNSALQEARTNGTTECPVCHAAMTFTRAGAREAECEGCGSRLS